LKRSLLGIGIVGSNSLNKLGMAFLLTSLFLVPNTAVVVGGLLGTYLTYVAWSGLIAVSLLFILDRRGFGRFNAYTALVVAGSLIAVYTIMGLFWGFTARIYPNILSLAVSMGLFAVRLTGIEAGRALAMGLARNKVVKLAIGTAVGLSFGETYYVLLSRFSNFYTNPISIVPGAMYSLVLSIAYLQGGFIPTLLFRFAVDVYWRFAPLVLNTARIGYAWPGLSTMIYYGTIIYLLYSPLVLRGMSRSLFKPKNFMRKAIEALPTAISLLFSFLLLIMLLSNSLPLVVVSGSMQPIYNIGDVVLIRVDPNAEIGVGDVIAFKMENGPVVVHRVIEVLEQGYRTKGDANPDPDPFIVDRRLVIGKVIGVIPKIGWITITAREGINSAATPYIVLTGASVAFLIGINTWRKRRKSNVSNWRKKGIWG